MTSVVKRLVPLRRSKGPGKLSLPAFPTPRHHASNTNKGDMSYIPNWPPNGCRGGANSSGFEGETRRWVRATQNDQSEGRSDTKGGQQLVHLVPH
jgi:hypothetical protein